MARVPALLVLLVLTALGATGCGQAVGDPTAAAVVNGEVIAIDEIRPLVAELAGAANPQTGQALDEGQATTQVLSDLTLLELLQQEIVRGGGDRVTDADVEAALAARAEELGGDEAFAADLGARGISRRQAALESRFDLVLDAIVAVLGADVEITDEDVDFAFASTYGLPNVAHILVDTEEAAQAVIARIEGGEDFAAVAQEVSADPGSAANGGELGPLQVGAYVPEFEDAALQLDPGELSDPVETQFGWHVIRTEAGQELTPELEAQVRDELLRQQVLPQLSPLLQRLIEEADVRANPRFGTWAPIFDPAQGPVQLYTADDPLGALSPAPGLQEALDGAVPGDGGVPPEVAPADPAAQPPAGQPAPAATE
jgi:peptidyl-prolyl cis-trans isomerase C